MKQLTGILFLFLLCLTPAALFPTQDEFVTSSDIEPLSAVVKEDAVVDEFKNEDTISDEDIDGVDDSVDLTEPELDADADADETENELTTNQIEQDPETAVDSRDGRHLDTSSKNETKVETQARQKPNRPKPNRNRKPGRRKPGRKRPNRRRPANRRRRPGAKRRRPNRRRPNRRRRPGKRRGRPGRRPANKGRSSSEISQTNELIDRILANFSSAIAPYEEVKVAPIPRVLKVLPWAYRTLSVTEEAALQAAYSAEEGGSEVDETSDNCTAAVASSEGAGNGNSTGCVVQKTSDTAENTDEKELDENNNQEDYDENEDQKEETIDTKPENDPQLEEKKDTKPDDTDEDDDDEELTDDEVFTEDPYPALKGNDTVEYYLQLVYAKEEPESEAEEDNNPAEKEVDKPESVADATAAAEEGEQRRKREVAKTEAKKPVSFIARVVGLNQLKRNRDVKVVQRGPLKVIRVPIVVGPLKLEFSEDSAFNRTSVTTEELPALLVLKEKNGKLTASRFVSKTIQPQSTQVTLVRSAGEEAPTRYFAGRLVTHLSQAMTRFWNNGVLMSRMNRHFREMFIVGEQQKTI